jgi:hypothetical protein
MDEPCSTREPLDARRRPRNPRLLQAFASPIPDQRWLLDRDLRPAHNVPAGTLSHDLRCLESLVTGSWFLHTTRLVCFEIAEESLNGGLEAIVVLPFREVWDVIFSDNSSQIPSCIRIEALPFLD